MLTKSAVIARKMKITEDYLTDHGFKKLEGYFLKVQGNEWNVSIRPTESHESWQLSVFRSATEEYGKLEGNLCADNNSMSFFGTVTTIEQIKNAMLEEIEQLQWLGVNTKGCVAVISVRERQQKPADELLPPVTHMIAKADGIVQSVTVTRGTALCKPGDAVTAGQKLISGYTDLGICVRGTQAKGEVYALTQRKITAISPSVYDLRGEQRGQTVKFALLIGKKRINFYKCSGILDTRCARIYSVWYMTLPGGFQLPLGIIKEVWLDYEASPGKPEIFDLSDAASRYLLDALADGQILASQTALREDDSAYILNGSYVCREMIAQIQIEENG